MDQQNQPNCSYCQSSAVDYDVLFNPWCDACSMRKWLINWGAQHRWLNQSFAQSQSAHVEGREWWVAFVKSARDHEVAEVWLRIALFEGSQNPPFLGTEHNHISLPPSDRDTFYEDAVFRNEWEARWACFFKSLQIPYRYLRGTEHEPADLPSSTVFWLPSLSWYQAGEEGDRKACQQTPEQTTQGAYCIVTGPIPAIREPERREHARRFAMRTGKAVYLLEGRIGLPSHWDGYRISHLTGEGESQQPLLWHECLSCHAVGVAHPLLPDYRFCLCARVEYRSRTPRLLQACLAARYAHFDGPTPKLLA